LTSLFSPASISNLIETRTAWLGQKRGGEREFRWLVISPPNEISGRGRRGKERAAPGVGAGNGRNFFHSSCEALSRADSRKRAPQSADCGEKLGDR